MFVYLIESPPRSADEGSIYKIGFSADPEKRVRLLKKGGALGAARIRYGLSWTDEVEPWQGESCKPYRLLWSAPADDPRAAERALHRRFAAQRIRLKCWPKCEWFRLSAEDVATIRSVERF